MSDLTHDPRRVLRRSILCGAVALAMFGMLEPRAASAAGEAPGTDPDAQARVDQLQHDLDVLARRLELATDAATRADELVARLGGAAGDGGRASAELVAAVRAQERAHARLDRIRAAASSSTVLADLDRAQDAAAVATTSFDGSVTRGVWAGALLDRIGAPRCDDNVAALIAWQVAEGTDARWNPLATTMPHAGSTTFNSASVRDYPSLEDGLDATIATLETGAPEWGYERVLGDLRGCAPAATTLDAVNASAWCRGCAGGTYAIGQLQSVATDPRTPAAVLVGS